MAYTRGLQGQDLTNGVLATAKHFVGYAVTEGGQNMAATAVGAHDEPACFVSRTTQRNAGCEKDYRAKYAVGADAGVKGGLDHE